MYTRIPSFARLKPHATLAHSSEVAKEGILGRVFLSTEFARVLDVGASPRLLLCLQRLTEESGRGGGGIGMEAIGMVVQGQRRTGGATSASGGLHRGCMQSPLSLFATLLAPWCLFVRMHPPSSLFCVRLCVGASWPPEIGHILAPA